jgi:SMC interacting uncharacterized protein involved in chromosome segregation
MEREMIPLNLPPWVFKGGALLLFLSIIFYAGCNAQKQRDANKINKLKDEISRHVEIIEVFQDNYDEVTQAIKDQNEAITEVGELHKEKVAHMQAAHDDAIRRLNRSNLQAVKDAEDEAAALRERMVRLSVGEACVESIKEIAK